MLYNRDTTYYAWQCTATHAKHTHRSTMDVIRGDTGAIRLSSPYSIPLFGNCRGDTGGMALLRTRMYTLAYQ